ncbi:F-box domain-containing protein [Colletotrichum scovillei]|nr:F-box domain-containing protein [Colletotrichum scovillei]KAF4776816.1 F-box domain-containing protein [Colletotrichum scovillei]
MSDSGSDHLLTISHTTYNVGHAVNPNYEGLNRPLYPVRAGGVVTNWQDADRIWNYALAELGASIPLSHHPIIMTEPLHLSPSQRMTMVSHVFEYLSAPAYHTASPALLSTYAANLPIALVIDSGYAGTSTLPVYDHAPNRNHARRHDVAGQAIDDWLQQALTNEVGLELPSNGAWDDVLWLAKTERCRVVKDFEEGLMQWKNMVDDGGEEEIWDLPDGMKVRLDTPLGLRAGEVSFNPSMLGLDVGGLQHDAFDVIMKCVQGRRESLCQNILLAGGNTMFPGFGARLKCELERLFGEGTTINIISPRNRAYSAWVGGSMLSELSTFERMCVTRAEYEEAGPEIANKRFL